MSNEYICPMPMRWSEIFNTLCTKYDEKYGTSISGRVGINIQEAGGPPIPLILGGWAFSDDSQKHERWQETIEWAKRHGFSDDVVLAENEKYYSVTQFY